MKWQVKKIGDICGIFNGGTPDTKNLSYWGNDHYWITPKDMGALTDIYVKKTSRKITGAGLKNSSAKILPINSIILSSRAPIGHLAINKVPMATNQGCKGLIPKKEVDCLFLFNFLLNSKDLLNDLGSGTTFKELSGSKLASIPIPIPPISEQKRIVKILDEVFALTEKAKENAEKNLQNARELFKSYLQSLFANPGDGWEEKKIEDITKVISGFSFDSKDFSSTNEIKSVKITNVGVKEFVEETDNYLPRKYKDTLKDYQVKEGNIVMALTRTIISAGLKVAVVPKSYDCALLNQRVAALIPIEKSIDQRYLYNFLCTDIVAKYVKSNVNTLMQPNLSINALKNLLVPCPSLPEQKRIVAKLDALSAETKKLETIYKQKLADLEELKKSVLQKAFKGELT